MNAALAIQDPPRIGMPGRLRQKPVRRRLQEPVLPALRAWLRVEGLNLARHAMGLRPFRRGEFGDGPESPPEAHRREVNQLLEALRQRLEESSQRLRQAARRAAKEPTHDVLRGFLQLQARGRARVEASEQVWDFYFRLFNQRQARVGRLLLAADRIALDCYQAVYTGLGRARSIPSPPPLAYVEGERGAATLRRGVPVRSLGRRSNPFPLVKLPYSRLLNPWTLGAIPHEVSHNLQSDLGLWSVLPRAIYQRLRRGGVDGASAAVWARWHKEIFADLCGLLLTGPVFVASLIGVVAAPARRALAFNPRGAHPTPYLRVLINLELLGRIGFPDQTEALRQLWNRLFPAHLARALPAHLRRSFPEASRLVVDTVCFTPWPQLGDKALAAVVSFGAKEQTMAEEAAQRLAAGIDPGIVPERFLIAAALVALERRLAPSAVVAQNFYNALERR